MGSTPSGRTIKAIMKSRVVVSLMSNAIAVGLVFVLSTLFITTLMKRHQHQWYTYVLAFLIAAMIGIMVYTFVYLAFGYLPMSHVGPDVLQRLNRIELALLTSEAIVDRPDVGSSTYRLVDPPI